MSVVPIPLNQELNVYFKGYDAETNYQLTLGNIVLYSSAI